MFCLTARNLGLASETIVPQHARGLAPAWAEDLARAARRQVTDNLTVDHALLLQREVIGAS